MVRFVHSADWQLGKAPHYLSDEARTRFSAARIDVIGTIGKLAVQEHCDFVVVCGDVFESNHIDRQVLVRALEKMRATPQVTFYLLPGNHDPLDASSIYRSPTFEEHRPGNVALLDGSEPLQAEPGVELIAAPWQNKRPLSDLVGDACEGLGPADAVRVVVGHGAVDSLSPDPGNPALISLSRLQDKIDKGSIHYVALGDRHSTTDVGGTGRVWYSGAPEPTDYDEVEPGNVLVVELDAHGVGVERRAVGTWRFDRSERALSSDADIDAVEKWLSGLPDKQRTIVKVALVGQVSIAQRARLDGLLAHHRDLFAALETWERRSELVVIPDDADLDDFGLSGYAREALSDLRTMAESDDEQQERELSEQWDATEHLCNEVQRLATAGEAAAVKRKGAARDQQRRDELIRDHESRVRDLAELESEAERAAPALASAARHADQAASSLAEARTALHSAEVQQRTAVADRDHRRQQIEVAQLKERSDRVIAAEKALKDAEAHLESAKVDDNLRDRIDEANLAMERSKAAFASGAASVETTALRDLSVRIDGEDVDLAAGEPHRTVVGVEAELSIPEVAVVRVRSGAGSKDLSAEFSNARDALRRLCKAGGVADLDEARRAAYQRSEAERRRSDALETIKRDLRDLTVDTLISKIEALNRRIGAYAEERSDDPPLPPDFEAAKKIASDADRLFAQCRDEFEARDAAAATADDALNREQLKEAELSGQIKSARGAEQLADEQLATARDERADADIAVDLVATTQHAEAAGSSLAEAEAKLKAADPDSIEVKLDNARRAALRAVDDLRSNQERQIELRSRLEVRGEQGLHTRHDEAATRLQHLEREHDSAEARAQAARLLHDTFERRRQQARQRYMEPFKQRIEQLGRIVFNETFAVDLDDDLSVVRRTLDGDTLDVDQLSTGALEQMGVVSRLACAAIVSPDGGGAPVIIDDALGWSDPDRLRNMGAAISAAGGQCQVIILTCTPGRYAHIGNATTIHLPSRT